MSTLLWRWPASGTVKSTGKALQVSTVGSILQSIRVSGAGAKALFQTGRIGKRLHEGILAGTGEFQARLFDGFIADLVQRRVKRMVVRNEGVVARRVIAKQHRPAPVR